MKKAPAILSALMVMVMVIIQLGTAFAYNDGSGYWLEDFKYADNTQPKGWTFITYNGTSTATVLSRKLHVNVNAGIDNEVGFYADLPKSITGSNVTVEFRFTIGNNLITDTWGFFQNDISYMMINGNRLYLYHDGENIQEWDIMYENHTYNFKIVYNFVAKTYDIYIVDETDSNNNRALEGAGFRNTAAAEVSRVKFAVVSSQGTTFDLDYVYVYIPSELISVLPTTNYTSDTSIAVSDPTYSLKFLLPKEMLSLKWNIKNNNPYPRLVKVDISLCHQDNSMSKCFSFEKAFDAYASNEIIARMKLPEDINTCKLNINAQAQPFNPSVNYYVSPNGSDTNAGTQSSPFKTIDRAKEAVRQLKASEGLPFGGVGINLMEGNHSIDKTITLTNEDSGSISSPVIYKSCAGGNAVITGDYSLPANAFTAVTDSEVLSKIPPNARNSVLQLDLKSLGFYDYTELTYEMQNNSILPSPSNLYVDNELQTLARYPNTGYSTMGAITNNTTFAYSGSQPANWVNASDAWVCGFFAYDWHNEKIKISSINTQAKTIKVDRNPVYGMNSNQRYYVYNLIEELDSPGEWYLNRATGILYYYPKAPLNGKKISLSRFTDDIFRLSDCKYVYFQGLNFQNTCAGAFNVINCRNIQIAGCNFNGIGKRVVNISGGKNCGVISSNIKDCGKGGIYLSGGDRNTLTPANHYAINCDISNFNTEIMTYQPAIDLSGCGNKASHNKIHNAPHNGIEIRGNDCLVEYNEFYNLCTQTRDSGAVYGGADWTLRGNIIIGNLFHDIKVYSGDIRTVYLDDVLSGTTICNNTFYDVDIAVFIHGGRDNNIYHNIIADSNQSIKSQDKSPDAITNPNGVIVTNYNKMPVTSQLWISRYPHISNILQDDPTYPKYNRVADNVIYNTPAISLSLRTYLYGTVSNNIRYTTDPGFTSISADNFSLSPTSRVFADIPGFTVAEETAGLYADLYRE